MSNQSPAGRKRITHLWKGALHRTAHHTARLTGHINAPLVAFLLVGAWAVSGFLLHYSNTWQIVLNTLTTVITFLLIFLLQTAQKRDTHAIQLKLDELISSHSGARNRLVALEKMSQQELDELQADFERMKERALAEEGEQPRRSRKSGAWPVS